VAALLLQAKPLLTNTQVYSLLQSTALDMATAGFDYDTGFGLIQADKALVAAAGASISGRVYKDSNASGSYDTGDTAIAGGAVFLDSNNNGSADSGNAVFSSSGSTAIPDATLSLNGLSRVSSSISSNATGRVSGLTVAVNISHARTSDLGLTLITPSGTRIPLLTTLGGVSSSKGTGLNLTLSDTAGSGIQSTSSAGLLTGTYRPQTPLTAATNENATGTWQLEARDYKSGTAGTINNWSLNLTYSDPATTTDVTGQYAFAGLSPTAFYGTYRVATPGQGGLSLMSPSGGSFALNLPLGGVAGEQDFRFVPSGAPATITSMILDDGSAQRSMVRSLTILLDGTIPLANIASGAFSVTQTSGPTINSYTATITAVTTPAAGQTMIALNFAGSAVSNGSLADGRFTLTIDGSKLVNTAGQATDAAGTGIAGSIKTYNFFRLSADADGDASVNFNDFLTLQNAFGSSSGDPTFNSGADNDANGVINFNDFLALQNQFGHAI
jgi:subtilisin-like proprotein convertase family protein